MRTAARNLVLAAALLAGAGCKPAAKPGGAPDAAAGVSGACRAAGAHACELEADAAQRRFLYEAQSGKNDSALQQQALALYEQACDLSSADACVEAADILDGQNERQISPGMTSAPALPAFPDRERRFARALQKACAIDPGELSCKIAAEALRDVDPARASAALARACSGADCERDAKRAIQRYVDAQRGCAKNEPGACATYGRLLSVNDATRSAHAAARAARAHDAFESECRLRGLDDALLGLPDPYDDDAGAAVGVPNELGHCIALLRDGPALAPTEVPDAGAPPTHARIRYGLIRARGDVDTKAVASAVKAREQDLLACYAHPQFKNPALEGRVTVDFVADRLGDAFRVQNGGSDLPDSYVVRCVIGVFSRLHVEPGKPGRARVPLMFEP